MADRRTAARTTAASPRRAKTQARASIENPLVPLSEAAEWLYDALGATKTTSGVRVSRDTALSVSAWWRGLTLVSDDVAKVPPVVYRREKAGKERATEHPAYNLLRYKPNAEMTAFTFLQTRAGHFLEFGNGYAWIVRAGGGTPVELIPLDPQRTSPIRENGRLVYIYESDDRRVGMVRFQPADVLHFKGFGYDGLVGYSRLAKAKEALGQELAMREHGTRFFSNGARLGVLLNHPKSLTKEAQMRFLEGWKRAKEGPENAWKTVILEEGMTASAPLTMSAKDAQLFEQRRFTPREIANFIGCPPHKLGDDSTKTYASLEQEEQAYLNSCLDPIFCCFEQEFRDKLLSEKEKAADSHVVEFNRLALVRADMTARYAAYKTATGGYPFQTVNEVRAAENLNALPGYDELKVPINLQKPEGAEAGPGGPPPPKGKRPPAEDDEGERLAAGLDDVRRDVRRRMLKRLAGQAAKAARSSDAMLAWLGTFEDENRAVLEEAFAPWAGAGAVLARRPARELAREASSSALADVRDACRAVLKNQAPGRSLDEAIAGALENLEK